MIAAALPAAAVARAIGNQNWVPDEKQPETAAFDKSQLNDGPYSFERHPEIAHALKSNMPLGSSIVQGDAYVAPVNGVRWLPSNNRFPENAQVHDCFYHEGKDCVYVLLETGWIRMGVGGQAIQNAGPFLSNSRQIEWVIEDSRVLIIRCPFHFARTFKHTLDGPKWHGFETPARKMWSCDLTHKNTVYLRNDCGTTKQDRSLG